MPNKDYISKVYSALSENIEGFNKTPQEFEVAMQDSAYAKNAFIALKENIEGFDKNESQFLNSVYGVDEVLDIPKKKGATASASIGLSSGSNSQSPVPNTQTVQSNTPSPSKNSFLVNAFTQAKQRKDAVAQLPVDKKKKAIKEIATQQLGFTPTDEQIDIELSKNANKFDENIASFQVKKERDESVASASVDELVDKGNTFYTENKADKNALSSFNQSREGKIFNLIRSVNNGERIDEEDVRYWEQVAPKSYNDYLEATKQKHPDLSVTHINTVADLNKEDNNTYAQQGGYQQIQKDIQVIGNVFDVNKLGTGDVKELYAKIDEDEKTELSKANESIGVNYARSEFAQPFTPEQINKDNEIRAKHDKMRSTVANADTHAYALKNPDKTVLELGEHYMELIRPADYKNYVQGGKKSEDFKANATKIGIAIAESSGNKEWIDKGQIEEQQFDAKYPKDIEEELRRRLAIEKLKQNGGANWVLNENYVTVGEADEYIKQIPEKKLRDYYTNVFRGKIINQKRQYAWREGVNTDKAELIETPNPGGIANEMFTGAWMPMKGIIDVGVGMFDTKEERANRAIAKPKLSEQKLIQRKEAQSEIKELEAKPKPTVDDINRINDLKEELTLKSGGQDVADNMAGVTAGVGGQGLLTVLGARGLQGLSQFVNIGTKAIPIVDKFKQVANWASEIKNSNNVAGSMIAYLSTVDAAKVDAQRLMPDATFLEKQGYAQSMAFLNAATERLFKDEKIFNAFKKEIAPELATLVKKLSSGKIQEAAFSDGVKNLITKSIPKYVGGSAIETTKETLEEVAVEVGKTFLKGAGYIQGVVDKSDFNIQNELEAWKHTFNEMLVGGLPTGILSGIGETRRNAITQKGLYDLAKNPNRRDEFIEIVRAQQAAGKMSEGEAIDKIQGVNTLGQIYDQTLPIINKVKPLNEREAVALTSLLYSERKLKKDIENPELSDIKSLNEKQLSQIQKKKDAILNGEVIVDNDLTVLTPEEWKKKQQGVLVVQTPDNKFQVHNREEVETYNSQEEADARVKEISETETLKTQNNGTPQNTEITNTESTTTDGQEQVPTASEAITENVSQPENIPLQPLQATLDDTPITITKTETGYTYDLGNGFTEEVTEEEHQKNISDNSLKINQDATKKRNITESDKPKYQNGNQSRSATETGDSNSTQQSGKIKKETVGKLILEPSKPIEEMNSDELYEFAIATDKALKAQEKEFEGKAEQEKEDAGYYDYIDNVESLRDASTRINFIENAEDLNDLARSTKSALREIKTEKPNEYSLAILNAVKKRAVEIGIAPEDLTKEILSIVGIEYKDNADARTMMQDYFNKIMTPVNETTENKTVTEQPTNTVSNDVGEEMAEESMPDLEEVYELLMDEEGRQGGSWLGNEFGDAKFESEQQAREYAKEVHEFLSEVSKEKEIPIYRAVSADDVDLDPYSIGESWSFDINSAKEFGRHLGVPLSKVKIISGKVPTENVDWKQAVRLYHSFSDIADGNSEFELPIPSNRVIKDVRIEDFKNAKERTSTTQTTTTNTPTNESGTGTTQPISEPIQPATSTEGEAEKGNTKEVSGSDDGVGQDRATITPTVLEEGNTVTLPPQRAGFTEREMIFKDGEWQQKVGGQITKVGKPTQKQAQEAFDNSGNQEGDIKLSLADKVRMGIKTLAMSFALSANPSPIVNNDTQVAMEASYEAKLDKEAETQSRQTVIDIANEYYEINGEKAPQEVAARAVHVWELFGKPFIERDAAKEAIGEDTRAETRADLNGIYGISGLTDFIAEMSHRAQYMSKKKLDFGDTGEGEYERKGSVEYDAHKILEPLIAQYIFTGKTGEGLIKSTSFEKGIDKEVIPTVQDYLKYSQLELPQREDTKEFETDSKVEPTVENIQKKYPDAKVVANESILPIDIKMEIKKLNSTGQVRALYDQRNGDIYIVANRFKTMGEVDGAYRHEKLGHSGVMEELKDKLDEFATSILDKPTPLQKVRLEKISKVYHKKPLSELTEKEKSNVGQEYIAQIAENPTKDTKLWEKIKQFVKDTFRKLGIKLNVSDREIKALIRKVETKKSTTENVSGEEINFQLDEKPLSESNKATLDKLSDEINNGTRKIEDVREELLKLPKRFSEKYIKYIEDRIAPPKTEKTEPPKEPPTPTDKTTQAEENNSINRILNKRLDEINYPNILFDENLAPKSGEAKQITAKTQGRHQDREVDGQYVKQTLDQLREISLQTARELQDLLGSQWTEKTLHYLEQGLGAKPAQTIGVLNIISTNILQDLQAEGISNKDYNELRAQQKRVDNLTNDVARQISLGLNMRRVYKIFAQGGNVNSAISEAILPTEVKEQIDAMKESISRVKTDAEMAKANRPTNPTAPTKTTTRTAPQSSKSELRSRVKDKASQMNKEGKSLQERVAEIKDKINKTKC